MQSMPKWGEGSDTCTKCNRMLDMQFHTAFGKCIPHPVAPYVRAVAPYVPSVPNLGAANVSEEVDSLADMEADVRGNIEELKERERKEQEDERQYLKKIEEGKTYWNGKPYGKPPNFFKWKPQFLQTNGKGVRFWDGRYYLDETDEEGWGDMLTSELSQKRFEAGRAYERTVQQKARLAAGDAGDDHPWDGEVKGSERGEKRSRKLSHSPEAPTLPRGTVSPEALTLPNSPEAATLPNSRSGDGGVPCACKPNPSARFGVRRDGGDQ